MGKKILLSLPENSSFYPGVYRAFYYLGYEVINFDFRKFSLSEKILTISGKQNLGYESLNRRLIEVASSWRPNIFLAFKAETLSRETLNKIKKIGAKTINWFPDGLWKLDLMLKLVSDYDIFFHFDSLASEVLQKKGYKNVRYLPYAADMVPSDKPLQCQIKKYPVSFIGNYYPEREEYFTKIANEGFYLWGEKFWKTTSLVSNYQGICQYSKVKDILSETRICANLHYQTKSNGANLRVYEATAAGACLLTDYKKDLEKMYDFGKEIVAYNGIKDFTKKLDFLIGKDELTRKIGQNGYKRTKNEHTYVHRIKDLLKFV